ncbi:hypothetical protein OQA88_7289 [Cercophora sp. LCS_1]
MTDDMMSFYHGHEPGGTPGLLPQPYYWWEAGALMGSLVDYWYYTGDAKWNDMASEGLLFQVGPNNDYMPPNQTMTEGNDDQGFWGMVAMSAAEYTFPNPPDDKPQWLALAQAVFNTQAARWDEQDCGGGLRWQIFSWNNGYDYKNSISQACFFNIASRLARYTGNNSYADWASKSWDWMAQTELLNLETYYIYDGVHTNNCSSFTPYQWSYSAGAFLLGAAAMYNNSAPGSQAQSLWRQRVDGLLNGIMVFFTGPDSNIMTEVACEPVDLCDLDQQSFKAYLARWMAATTKWAPFTRDRIAPLLKASAVAAASTCTGGGNGRMCGLKWTNGSKWDGTQGVGQQMAAMEVLLATTVDAARDPVTDGKGGLSKGDPGAGGVDVGRTSPWGVVDGSTHVTQAGRAGAWILTVLTLSGLVAGIVFVLFEEGEENKSLKEMFGWKKAVEKGKGLEMPCGREEAKKELEGVVVKTHEDVGISDECPGGVFAGGQSKPRPKSMLSDTSSYWSANYAESPSKGRERGRRSEQRLPYPLNEGASALRKKTLTQNHGRAVRWRETKQYV